MDIVAHPQPVQQMRITVMDNGQVVVNGFPSNLHTSLLILHRAYKAVTLHFIDAAKNGQIDNYNLVESKIITPDKKLVAVK